MLNYVSSVVRGYTISSRCVRVAAIQYSNDADAPIQLSSYSDADSLVQAIDGIQFLGGGSNLATALDLLRSQVFASNIIRSNTVQIAIIVTDQLQSSPQITDAINRVKSQGITIVGVAITGPGRVDVNFYNTLISPHPRENCLNQVRDYSQLVTGARNLVVRECACLEYTTTTTTTTTTTPRPPAPEPDRKYL